MAQTSLWLKIGPMIGWLTREQSGYIELYVRMEIAILKMTVGILWIVAQKTFWF